MKNRNQIAHKLKGKEIISFDLAKFVEQAPDLEQCIGQGGPQFNASQSDAVRDKYFYGADRSLKLVPGAAVFVSHNMINSLVTEKHADETYYVLQYQHQSNSYNLSNKNLNLRNKFSVSAISSKSEELMSHERGAYKNIKIVMNQTGLENLIQLTGSAPDKFNKLKSDIRLRDYLFYQFDVPLTMRTKFEELMKLVSSKEDINILALSSQIFGLVTDMFALIEQNGFNQVTLHSKRQNNLAQSAKNFVDDYANMVTNAQQLADMLNTSVSTLQRQFKTAYEISIGQYIKDKRLCIAADFLDQDMSIEEVSEMLGYSYRSAFERAFKNYHGYSPGNHRKTKDEALEQESGE